MINIIIIITSLSLYNKFYKVPDGNTAGIPFATFLITETKPREDAIPRITEFCQSIIDDASRGGLKLTFLIQPTAIRQNVLNNALVDMKKRGARFAFIIMNEDGIYGSCKLISDSIPVLTQNVKMKTVLKNPRGISTQIALKLNSKLSGINHVLASRLPSSSKKPDTWQPIPASISWLFDRPSMVVGIDVSHPDKSNTESESIAGSR